MDFRRDDPIRVIAGVYKGKTGTFIELTGNESGRVKLDNDTVANRTLRMTSLIREDYESDGEERVTMKKSTYDDLVADLEELQQQITDMKYRLKTAVARGNQKPKKKRSKKLLLLLFTTYCSSIFKAGECQFASFMISFNSNFSAVANVALIVLLLFNWGLLFFILLFLCLAAALLLGNLSETLQCHNQVCGYKI